ncbi:MAG: LytTR family DNA-binding domain-containing protein [Candidatus Sulfotelmatobacter sp.]
MGIAIVDKTAAEQTASLVEAFPSLPRFTSPTQPRIAFKVKGRILFINPGEVVAVESEGNYVWLRRESVSHLLRESLSVVAEKLEPHGFIRIHRSVLVNASFVEEIRPYSTGEYGLRVKGGKEYTVTRTYKRNLKSLAAFWLGTGALFSD